MQPVPGTTHGLFVYPAARSSFCHKTFLLSPVNEPYDENGLYKQVLVCSDFR